MFLYIACILFIKHCKLIPYGHSNRVSRAAFLNTAHEAVRNQGLEALSPALVTSSRVTPSRREAASSLHCSITIHRL